MPFGVWRAEKDTVFFAVFFHSTPLPFTPPSASCSYYMVARFARGDRTHPEKIESPRCLIEKP